VIDRTGLIGVFAKPPTPGKAKTRLAAKVGPNRAAELASAFLGDTWALATSVPWARAVLASTDEAPEQFALPGSPEIWLQGEGDLGARLERVVRRGLTEADFVVAIGADSPGLPPLRLDQARAALLSNADAVLGPSEDGGFYLVGLRRCPEGSFSAIPWSDSTTLDATRARLLARGLTVELIEPWFDVDVPDDLERLRGALARGEIDAPRTAAVLFGSREDPCPRL
jgi:rSAM/selenodomain-associated transferase 1